MFDDPLIGKPGWLRGYPYSSELGAMDALRTQQITNQTLAMMQAATQLSFMPTPSPPDDGQLHISIRKKRMKFNFNN
ncbi:MAG: hypothetical protein IJV24_07150 [Prevotella sp.]|nr:hypothetical protein [Prevotella sp.]